MRKAGKLQVGELSCSRAVPTGGAKLLLLAADASDNARKRATQFLYGKRTLLIELPYTKGELSELLGKGGCSMAAVMDIGLASAFLEALSEEEPGRYDEAEREIKRRKEKAVRRKAMGPKSKSGRNK